MVYERFLLMDEVGIKVPLLNIISGHEVVVPNAIF
jgi:hypothetical protein